MRRVSTAIAYYLATACLLLTVATSSTLADDWKPIDPAHLALKSSIVEKDADAEVIFWEVKVDDNPEGDLIFSNYIRIKVFTERGRESQSRIDIPFGKISNRQINIRDIAARTIKPDGSIVELKKGDVFERTIVKRSGVKIKAKSFAMPAVEAGSLIEYRWQEVQVDQSANGVRLEFQRDIPVQRVKYSIKPYPFVGMVMRTLMMNGNNGPMVKEGNGFYSTTMTNMPAVHEEDRMPPENQVKMWMLIYYSKDEKLDPEKYWTNIGKLYFEILKSRIKPNDEVKAAAVTAIGDAKTDEEKVERLFNFVRTKIRNVSDDASGMTGEERTKLKSNKSPADTLKRGVGVASDIDMLFAALATAAGFEARVVLAPDRGDVFFDKGVANSYFLQPSNVGVRLNGSWKLYNPGMNNLPLGMLRWQEEGQLALVTDGKEPMWIQTPLSTPQKSHIKRIAKLKLSEDGTLEGDVRIEFTGHPAIERREDTDDESASQREESLKDTIKARMSTAELTNITVENVGDPALPLVHAYHLRVPGYAPRTGKRVFLQPAFFQHGLKPFFSTSERKYQVYFHYPWSESDEVIITLPAGYALDSPDAPAPVVSPPVSEYTISLVITGGRTLTYKRKFYFGGEGNILFPPTAYAPLKSYFDMINRKDNHTLTLKQTAAPSGN